MLHFVYSLSLSSILFLMLLTSVLWAHLAGYGRSRGWCAANALLAMASVALILYTTIFSRSPSVVHLVVLCPFAAFAAARFQPELYREMLMNVFLFFPLGLTFSNSLPKRFHCWVRIGVTVLCGYILSVGIEYAQYRYALGTAETDDVICNTLGAFLGSASLLVCCAIEKWRSRPPLSGQR